MDQLKPVLEACKKHLFWILTGIAVVLGCVGFFLANSTINKKYEEQETALNGHFDNVQKVQREIPTHPNEISREQMQKKIDALADDVRAAWQEQYDRQARYLVWPDSIRKTNPALVAKLDSYRPVELKTTYPEEPKDITKGLKQAYARYFDLDMPRIAKIIGVEWIGEASQTAAGGMGGYGGYGGMGGGGMGGGGYGGDDDEGGYGGYGGMGGMGGYGGGMGGGYGGGGYGGYGGGAAAAASNKPRDLVTWPKTSQDEVLSNIKMWTGDTPNIYEILYTQENMWILEGILHIIRRTNLLDDGSEPTANFQCAIKEIEFLRLGKSAGGQAGSIDGAAAGGGGMYGGMMSGYGGGSYGGGSMGYGGGSMGYGGGSYGGGEEGYGGEESYGGGMYGAGAPVSRDPADGRYVDANFNPVTGEDLRAKMQSSEPADAYFAVAKRIPVRMRVSMDQRKIPHFLANCGNADLMLEVRQVRVGDTPAAAGGAGGGGGGGYGGYMGGSAPGAGGLGGMSMGGADAGYGGEGGEDSYGGYGGGYGGGGYGGYGGGAGTTGGAANFDVDVEIYGIVYLFNPVDIERLGLNKVTEDTQLDDTVEVPDPSTAQAPPSGGQSAPAGDGTSAGAGSGAAGSGAEGAEGNQPPSGQGAGQPGAGQPGAGQPGAGQPGAGQPGAGQPGAGQPNNRRGAAGGPGAGGRMPPPGGAGNPPPAGNGPPPPGAGGNPPPPGADADPGQGGNN